MTTKNLRAGLAAGIKDTPKRSTDSRDRFERADEALEIDRETEPVVSSAASVGEGRPLGARKHASDGAHPAKDKVVREIVSMPPSDVSLLEELRKRSLESGRFVSKSEMVRAGLHVLARLSTDEVAACVDVLEKRRPGRRPGQARE